MIKKHLLFLEMGDTSVTGFREIALPAGCRIAQLVVNRMYAHSFLLCDDDRLFVAGANNAEGALCLESTQEGVPFTQITLPAGKTLKTVTSCITNTILLMTDGSLYGCGSSSFAQVLFAPRALTLVVLIVRQGNNENSLLPAASNTSRQRYAEAHKAHKAQAGWLS
ncbi:hypothetical protein PAPYR_1727 [Paratrimastix pyriformis]|uniref:Uncharacterized protein n=1 Tax=Paratrimastix pyriformis TaxID=342808 RepID=A0ABQ8US16_9EUKA|nr:hypothetical protein PAPYR_1727 [Paratrimastix pyriformis]